MIKNPTPLPVTITQTQTSALPDAGELVTIELFSGDRLVGRGQVPAWREGNVWTARYRMTATEPVVVTYGRGHGRFGGQYCTAASSFHIALNPGDTIRAELTVKAR